MAGLGLALTCSWDEALGTLTPEKACWATSPTACLSPRAGNVSAAPVSGERKAQGSVALASPVQPHSLPRMSGTADVSVGREEHLQQRRRGRPGARPGRGVGAGHRQAWHGIAGLLHHGMRAGHGSGG